MDLLESLDPGDIKGQMIWCYYEETPPNRRIQNLVAQHKGALVPSPDFDLLMVLLGAAIVIEPLDNVIEKRAKDRAAKYRERIIDLDATKHPEVDKALASIIERAGGAMAWEVKASKEKDSAKKRSIYERGIAMFPQSAELLGNYARLIEFEFKDLVKAGELYEKAHAANPQSPRAMADLAAFLVSNKGDHDRAETLYRRALDLDPRDVDSLRGFARLLAKRQKMEDAERYYRTALQIQPDNPDLPLEFAVFLAARNPPEAEVYYKRACELSPDDYQIAEKFGRFLALNPGNLAKAVKYYRQAADRAPAHLGYRLELAALLARQTQYDLAIDALTEVKTSGLVPDNEFQKRVALYEGVIFCCAYPGDDDAQDRANLKWLLLEGPLKLPSNAIGLDNLRHLAQERLKGEQRRHYIRLILDLTGSPISTSATTDVPASEGNGAAFPSSNLASEEVPLSTTADSDAASSIHASHHSAKPKPRPKKATKSG